LFSDKGDLPLMEIKKPIDIKCALCAYKNAQASSFKHKECQGSQGLMIKTYEKRKEFVRMFLLLIK
jgi:hypothetical protein